MAETALHQALKVLFAGSSGLQEALVEGYQIDVLQGELLVEIQTRNFSALKSKLSHLLDNHPVHLVHPLAREKWLVTIDPNTAHEINRRRSPRRGRLEDLFYELVRIPHLVKRPNFSLEVLLIRELEIRRNDGRGSWRRRGVSIVDRRLLEVLDSHLFTCPDDYRIFLPGSLPETFTSLEFTASSHLPNRLASKAVYCLFHMGLIRRAGRRGRMWLYEVVATDPNAAANPPANAR